MGVCDSIFKFFVLLFNFIFFLVGCAIIGLGSYMYFEMKDYLSFLGKTGFVDSTIVLIVVGVVLTVVSFFGICAVCTDNACMLYTFGSLMTVVVLVEVGVAIAILILKIDAEEAISNAMNDSLDSYGTDGDVTSSWDEIQQDLGCCGVNDYNDWKNTTFNQNGTTNNAPTSCCKDSNDCVNPQLENGTIYETGCLKQFEQDIEDNAYIVGGAGAGLGVFQTIALIASCCLAKKMRDRDDYV